MLVPQRHLFDIPRDVCYLNTAYMAPMPTAFGPIAAKAVEQRMRPWEVTPTDFFTGSEDVRSLAASVFSCDSDDIAFVPAASYAVATVARNLRPARGSAILTIAEEFPSNVYGWQKLAADCDCELIAVPGPAEQNWTASLLEQIDDLGDRLSLVAIPHVHWSTGAMIDLKQIRAATRKVGAALFLDLTQSLGALPVSMEEIQPDFAVAAGYKWLFGPYALGYFYAHKDWQKGKPLEENWITRKNSEDFSNLTNYQSDYQPGARRFDMGERSNFQLMPLAKAALTQILGWEISNIADTLRALNNRLADKLVQHGFDVTPEDWRSPHLMAARHPEIDARSLAQSWKDKGIYVSVRGDWIRIAPHLWVDNKDEEKFYKVLS